MSVGDTALYAELEDRILARDQVGANRVFSGLARAQRPLAEIIRVRYVRDGRRCRDLGRSGSRKPRPCVFIKRDITAGSFRVSAVDHPNPAARETESA